MNLNDTRDRASTSFLALSCVGLFATAAPAIAQSNDQQNGAEGQKLGGVVVTDTAIDEEGYKVDKADSPKFTAPLVNTPRSVTVIPSQLIHDTASASLTEALRTVPGITLGAGEGGNPLGDRPFIRGFDSQASTYLDGVRDIGAQSREVFAVEQIEVVKGSDSSMGGRGSAGGSINLVSKAPKADRFIAASGSLGNADYKRATIDINQPINEFVGVRLNAMWHDQDVAGRDAIWSKRWGVAPSLKLGLDGPTSLTIGYYHLHTEELPDSGIPYLYTIGNAPAGVTETGPAQDFTTIGGKEISVPRGAYYGLKDRDFRDTNVDNFTIRAEHDFGSVTLRNTTRYGRSTQGYVWTQPDDQQGNVYGTNAANPATAGGLVWRRTNTRYSKTDGLLNQTDLSGEFSIGGIKNSFSASVEFSQEKAANGTYVSNAATGAAIASGSSVSPRCSTAMLARYNCTTVDNPNPSDPWISYASDSSTVTADIVRSAPKTWTLSKTTTQAASFFDTITITDQLLINLGGRFDRYKTSVSPGLAATSTANRSFYEREDDLWNYQAGIIFKPTENSSLYASASSSATPPGAFLANGSEGNALNTTSQALTDALKVEKTKSYEIGAKANLFGDALSLTLAAFRTETKNARATNDAGTVAYIGERKIEGIELGFNGNITPEWNVFGGYTYMDSEIVDGGSTVTTVNGVSIAAPSVNTGKQFPNTPKHSLTAFTNYKITPAFTIGGGAIYMAKVYGGYSDTRTISNGAVVITKELARMVPSYWRFDGNASYAFSDAVSLQVNVNNVFNKRYYDKAYAAHYANQAAGRTAIATLNIKY
ncbi:Outer membrane receptor for monomeric catechols precursor [Sphingobium yanoikuyae]|uniref:Outer membrane receptor for monomeric catechols n=2 Tax=Sphingobium TaxID=165695 RepID=A0A084E3Z2_SPHYA|nr:TonB-dependent receptor [Sphingobium yanoikuyae]KEZ12684.1 Outer membrane receptor for monomeric catechols precursor [Sphingobium yanoikuyae]